MELAIKRLLDVVLSCLAGIVVLPLSLCVALAILIDTGSPVLFTPERVGRGFTGFTQYKFRTMVKDAQARLPQIAHLNVAPGMVKIPNDPRVTRVGRLLRRFSLDELPQLLNVIRGDMSLVGPRPALPWEAELIEPAYRQRFLVPPGLTGLWQVSGRNSLTMKQGLEFDIEYVRRQSFAL